jgi:hypothetical protein
MSSSDRFQWFPGVSCPTWTVYAVDPAEEPGKLHVLTVGNRTVVAEPGDWIVRTDRGLVVERGVR